MNHKRLTLILVTILTLSMGVPMIYASRRMENFGDPIGNLIDEDDPTLIGPATVLTNALDKVAKLEEDLDIDLNEKSTIDLSPKDQAKLDRAITKANRAIDRFIDKAGLTNEKSLNEVEADAMAYLTDQLAWIN
jgi:hypothetical protein